MILFPELPRNVHVGTKEFLLVDDLTTAAVASFHIALPSEMGLAEEHFSAAD